VSGDDLFEASGEENQGYHTRDLHEAMMKDDDASRWNFNGQEAAANRWISWLDSTTKWHVRRLGSPCVACLSQSVHEALRSSERLAQNDTIFKLLLRRPLHRIHRDNCRFSRTHPDSLTFSHYFSLHRYRPSQKCRT
jgi:hypothetical protein